MTLTITATGDAIGQSPDLLPLYQDFDIRSQREQQSSSISIINGQTTATNIKEYILTLRPKRTGQLLVPPLQVGAYQTQSIPLRVAQPSGGAQQPPNPFVFFETSVDTEETYVQGQVIYAVKLFYTEGTGGEFPREPKGLAAVIETLERESRYEVEVQGRRYFVLEKRYALFPQASGELFIPPETFVGVRGQGGPFGQRQQVHASSRGHRVRVKPIPASFSGDAWLPAKSLTLSEGWSARPPVFRVGEPVNRQLTIVATGISESLLPSLGNLDAANAKVYADPPSLSKQLGEAGVTATQTTSVGIVPTREGPLRLPEIRIPWWNTVADREEVAVIPARTYQALAGRGVVTAPPVPLPVAADGEAGAAAGGASALWPLAAALLGLLWLASSWQWLALRRQLAQLREAGQQEEPGPQDPDAGRLHRELLAACKGSKAAEAHRLLLAWARARDPALGSLADLAPGQAALAEEIRTLESCLYKDGKQEGKKGGKGKWQGGKLAALLAPLGRQAAPAGSKRGSGKRLAASLNPVPPCTS